MPVPTSVAPTVPPGVAVTPSVAVAPPIIVGANRIWIVHAAPGASVCVHVLPAIASSPAPAPVRATPGMPVTCPPVFVTVNVSGADEVPMTTEPKSRAAGVITIDAADTPSPEIPAVTEPPGAPATVSEACATPPTVGRNATEIVHCAPGASAIPLQPSLPAMTWNRDACEPPRVVDSGPVAVAAVFVIVNCRAAEVWPTLVFANACADGAIASWPTGMPMPPSVVDTEPPGLVARVSSALRLPIAVGLNVTVTVQLAPAASETPAQPTAENIAASGPVSVRASTAVDAPVLVFVTTAVRVALDCPTTTEPKSSWSGTLTRLAGPWAVPVTAPVTTPPGVPEIWNSPAFAPTEVGVNRTWNAQLAPPASTAPPHVSTDFVNSAGSLPAGWIASGPLGVPPVFVMVNVDASVLVCPTITAPSALIDVETVSAPTATPVPSSAAEMLPPGVPPTTTIAVFAPGDTGENATVTEQLAPGGNLTTQPMPTSAKLAASAPATDGSRLPVVRSPVFVIVNVVGGLIVPTVTEPNW